MDNQQHIHIDRYERRWIAIVTVMLAVFFASLLLGATLFNVRPAQEGGFVNPNLLDETMFASPGVRHLGDNRYEAVVLAYAWGFEPREMTVPEGAEVTFHVTSRDVIHGFMIEDHNINFELIPGHVAQARVHFNEAGTYKILCHQYCGRLHQAMHADIIVEEADQTIAASE